MAFQGKQPLFTFLQGIATGTILEEIAPAENYILDERVPAAREDDFLDFNGFASSAYNRDLWFKQHVDYTVERVALPAVSGTFSAINQPNWLGFSPDWDVVRIETLYALTDRAKRRGSDVDETEAENLIDEMLRARESGTTIEPFRQARIEKWIRHVNSGSDRRPAFVVPFAEVEPILSQADWANRLRDALGLGHVRPWAGHPMKILLMQYNLSRVHVAHIGSPAWAATPTVLDDVPGQMPNPCFFPAPKKASLEGYGYTVDLASMGAAFLSEFLHGHISYTLADIQRIGEVTTDVPPVRIAEAREDHRKLLEADLIHLGDLPTIP